MAIDIDQKWALKTIATRGLKVRELEKQLAKLTSGRIVHQHANTVLLTFDSIEQAAAYCRVREGE